MRPFRTVCRIVAGASLLCVSAFAQTAAPPSPPHVPLQKVIGQGTPKLVPSLIVMNSRRASLQGGKLTLTGVTPNSILFADRPVRAAGHALTAQLLEGGVPSNDNSDSSDLEGDKRTFGVDVLEGALAGPDGPASIFIDRFGFGGFHAGGFHAGGMGGFHAGGFHAGGFGGYAGVG